MLNEQLARNVGPSHLDIAYERRGDPTDPVVLLLMGIAAQLVNWPEGFLDVRVRDYPITLDKLLARLPDEG